MLTADLIVSVQLSSVYSCVSTIGGRMSFGNKCSLEQFALINFEILKYETLKFIYKKNKNRRLYFDKFLFEFLFNS